MLRLFGGKPDHPMADLKEAKAILQNAQNLDAVKAAEEVSHWMDSVRRVEGFKPDYRVQLLLLIDDAAQPYLRKLQRDYLSAARLSRFQEQRLWTAIRGYYGQASLAFTACIDLYAAGGKGVDALKSGLPLLCVRALRSLAALIKWQYIRYGPFEGAPWGSVARVYAFAETHKIATANVAVYPGSAGAPGDSSPEKEFLRAVMLAASSPDCLLPAEMDIAERLIAQFADSFKLSLDQQPDIAYWIDLATDSAPLRLARPPKHAPTLRFFAAGGAIQESEKLLAGIEAGHMLPAGLNLGGTYEPETVAAVLRHLLVYWSPKFPERRHPRHRVKSRLLVSPGLPGVMDEMGGEASLDFDTGRIENWIVEDVSAGGFGAVIPQFKGDWLKVGALVALQPEGGDNWIIGIIRRLVRETAQNGNVGIQSLARAAAAVSLRVKNGPEGELAALLLSPDLKALEAQLLAPVGTHVAGRNFEFDHGGKTVMLMAAKVDERGDDFELIRGKQMIRDTGE
jgi:hypothetical protein